MKALLIFLFLLISVQFGVIIGFKDWYYIFESTTATHNSPYMEFNIRPKRIERGKYGLCGNVTVKRELDNNITCGVKVYRSDNGNSDYKLLPFRVPKTRFYKALEVGYIKLGMMESAKDCSNLPQVKGDKWLNPVPAAVYHFKDCLLSTERLPDHLPVGYYKVETLCEDDKYNLIVHGVVKIERELPNLKLFPTN